MHSLFKWYFFKYVQIMIIDWFQQARYFLNFRWPNQNLYADQTVHHWDLANFTFRSSIRSWLKKVSSIYPSRVPTSYAELESMGIPATFQTLESGTQFLRFGFHLFGLEFMSFA